MRDHNGIIVGRASQRGAPSLLSTPSEALTSVYSAHIPGQGGVDNIFYKEARL